MKETKLVLTERKETDATLIFIVLQETSAFSNGKRIAHTSKGLSNAGSVQANREHWQNDLTYDNIKKIN